MCYPKRVASRSITAAALFMCVAFSAALAQGEAPAYTGYERPDKMPPAELMHKAVKAPKALPTTVDLSPGMPPVIGQTGLTASCQSWAVGYYAYGYMVGQLLGWDLTQPEHQFSGMMLYWLQDRGENAGGRLGVDTDPSNGDYAALTWLNRKGICTVAQWGGLWPEWYQRPCTTADLVNASHYTADREALFVNVTDPPYANNYDLVKQSLSEGIPVIIGFDWRYIANPGNPTAHPYMWTYGINEYEGLGHAICLVGYDDNYDGVGAFKALNSEGPDYGLGGNVWLSYDLMERGVYEAWIITNVSAAPPSTGAAEVFVGPYVHNLDEIDPRAGGTDYLIYEPRPPVDGAFDEQSEDIQFTLDSNLLGHSGLYSGGIRFQNGSGEWGVARRFDVRIDHLNRLAAAEAFVDEDPGEGNGFAIDAVDGALDQVAEQLTGSRGASDFTPGTLHRLYVRIQDEDGAWSIPRYVTFEVGPPIRIVQAEWVSDAATPNGEGQPMAAGDGAFDSAQEQLVANEVTPNWPQGAPEKIWVRAQDALGRWGEGLVEDTTPPDAVCQEITITLNAAGSAVLSPALLDGGSTDNWGVVGFSAVPDTFTCDDLGANPVTLTVSDLSGNSSTCVATVTVIDSTAPVMHCKPATVQLDENGQATISPADVDNGSQDACGIAQLEVSDDSFTGQDLGLNAVFLTATDASGNTATCEAAVTVEDRIAPEVVCQPVQLTLDNTGQVLLQPQAVDAGSADNVGITQRSLSQSVFTCADLGSNTVTLTVTDASGNSDTCTATVELVDSLVPSLSCKNAIVALDTNGMGAITTADVVAASVDNCGDVELSLSQDTFTCADLGTVTVTVTASDPSGNTTTCDASVTVTESIAPEATCISDPLTLALDSSGEAILGAEQVDGGSTDNCGIASRTLDKARFTAADLAASPHTVTLTVADSSGNAATCTAQVNLIDEIPPVAVCRQDTLLVKLDAQGAATLLPENLDDGSSDNVGIASMVLSRDSFTCNDVSETPILVELTVTDTSGNSATCKGSVRVVDDLPPVLNCSEATLPLEESGQATLTFEDVGEVSDNCSVASVSLSKSEFTCADFGAQTVTVTARDAHGNEAACEVTVNIVDLMEPALSCTDGVAQLDGTGSITITGQMLSVSASDNCGLPSLSYAPVSFGCADVGEHQVTVAALDTSGNSSTCNALLTIEDTAPPDLVCAHITVQLDEQGTAEIGTEDVVGTAGDNCALEQVTLSQTQFTCADLGENTVLVTAVDASGNSSTCEAAVTVIDATPPQLTLAGETVMHLTCGGAFVDPGVTEVTDNCGVAGAVEVEGAVDAQVPGEYLLTYRVVDGTGNVSEITRTVEVDAPCGGEGEGEPLMHSADQNGDSIVQLSELLRVIQFFNSAGYHCDPLGEDGFAPGPGPQDCLPHTSDYNPQDWTISLSELLRVIQFFNSGGYHACETGEDGFCVGLPPV